MKIISNRVNYGVLIFINGLYGMQSPETSIIHQQKNAIKTLASSAQKITEKDIRDASKCLDDSLFEETIDVKFLETLNAALFRLAQTAIAMDEEKIKIAKILTEMGASPLAQFSIEETLSIEKGSQYAQTSHSFQSDAKREAKGKLKEYLDSLK